MVESPSICRYLCCSRGGVEDHWYPGEHNLKISSRALLCSSSNVCAVTDRSVAPQRSPVPSGTPLHHTQLGSSVDMALLSRTPLVGASEVNFHYF